MKEFQSENKDLQSSAIYETEIGKEIGDSTSKYHELEKAHLGNGLLSRIFPSDVAKELIECEVQLAKQEVTCRKRMHGVLREFEAQMITETANSFLESGKSAIRKRLGEDFQKMSDELNENLSKIDDVFQENAMREKAKIENCPDELMKELRAKSFKEAVLNHFRVKSRLIERFNDILDERIDTLSGKTKGSLL